MVPGSAVLSMIRTATPSLVSQSASTRPGRAGADDQDRDVGPRSLRAIPIDSHGAMSPQVLVRIAIGVGADDTPDRRGAAGIDVGPAGHAEEGRAGDPEHKRLTDDRQRLEPRLGRSQRPPPMRTMRAERRSTSRPITPPYEDVERLGRLHLLTFKHNALNHVITPAARALTPPPGTASLSRQVPNRLKGRLRLLLLGEPCGCLRHIFSGLVPKKMLPEKASPCTRLVPCKRFGLRPRKGVLWGGMHTAFGAPGKPRPCAASSRPSVGVLPK